MSQLNIIVLDSDPRICAQAYTDNDLMHRPAMYAETLQLAHTFRHTGLRKSRHVLARWAEDQTAWWWLYQLCRELLDEQWHRFGELDEDVACSLVYMAEDSQYDGSLPRFIRPINSKFVGGPVSEFRQLYSVDAEPSWTGRDVPEWWKGSVQYTLQF